MKQLTFNHRLGGYDLTRKQVKRICREVGRPFPEVDGIYVVTPQLTLRRESGHYVLRGTAAAVSRVLR